MSRLTILPNKILFIDDEEVALQKASLLLGSISSRFILANSGLIIKSILSSEEASKGCLCTKEQDQRSAMRV
jgi:hypothetical protein